jgi:hypothetical protein
MAQESCKVLYINKYVVHQIHSGLGDTTIQLEDSVELPLLLDDGVTVDALEHVDLVSG